MTVRTARTAAEALGNKLSPGPFDDEVKPSKAAPPKASPAIDLAAWSLDRMLEGIHLASALVASPKDGDAQDRWRRWCKRRHGDELLLPGQVGPLYVAEVKGRPGGDGVGLPAIVPAEWLG